MNLKELREKRAKLIDDAREILNTAENREAGKRGLTTEEQTQYDTLFGEADELRGRIEREERQREAERELEEALGEDEERQRQAGGGGDRERRRDNDQLMASFRTWCQNGRITGDGAEELRSLSAGLDTEGGYIRVPEQFITTLIKAIDDDVIVRQLANVMAVTSGASLGAPSLDNDPDDADWTEELATGSEDGTMSFGKRVMEPHPMAKRIKVSRTLLRTAALPVEALIRQRFAYKFGITQEKAYMTGNGNKRPLGLFTASNDGIPTGRDVSTGNGTTAPTFDGLINAKYSLKAGHQMRANWIFHRDVVKEIAKLKDGEGQYLWQPTKTEADPDMLLGRPARQSEYAPNTLTTGQYVGIFGNFDWYWIIDSLMMQMQRLDELYAETNQVGFIGRYEGDGAPVLAEAFARVKLA